MKTVGNQFLFLIIGLLLGLMAGGVSWYFWGNSGRNIIIVNQAPGAIEKNDEKKKDRSLKKKVENKPKPASVKRADKDNSDNKILTDTLLKDENDNFSGKELPEPNEKKLALELFKDTLGSDSSKISESIQEEEDIIVRKDELLFTKNIYINDLNKSDPTNKKDSLLQILRGGKEFSPSSFVVVEYWKSPINYKGYKMGKNKVILFGLQNSEKSQIFRLNDNLYLKNNDKLYKLDNSAEFNSYDVVTNQNILNQMLK